MAVNYTARNTSHQQKLNHTTNFFTELHFKWHYHCKVTSYEPHLAEWLLHHSLHVVVTTFQKVNLITSKTAGRGTRHSLRTMFLELPLVFQQYCTVSTANMLWDGQYGLQILTGASEFLLYRNCPNQLCAHPVSFSIDTKHSFPRSKAAEVCSWPLTSI